MVERGGAWCGTGREWEWKTEETLLYRIAFISAWEERNDMPFFHFTHK